MPNSNSPASPAPGLVTGGRGGPDDELLVDGQEEVFSRSEVELGRIEHDTTAGSGLDEDRESGEVEEPTPRPAPDNTATPSDRGHS